MLASSCSLMLQWVFGCFACWFTHTHTHIQTGEKGALVQYALRFCKRQIPQDHWKRIMDGAVRAGQGEKEFPANASGHRAGPTNSARTWEGRRSVCICVDDKGCVWRVCSCCCCTWCLPALLGSGSRLTEAAEETLSFPLFLSLPCTLLAAAAASDYFFWIFWQQTRTLFSSSLVHGFHLLWLPIVWSGGRS
jgi:hypothetical protein